MGWSTNRSNAESYWNKFLGAFRQIGHPISERHNVRQRRFRAQCKHIYWGKCSSGCRISQGFNQAGDRMAEEGTSTPAEELEGCTCGVRHLPCRWRYSYCPKCARGDGNPLKNLLWVPQMHAFLYALWQQPVASNWKLNHKRLHRCRFRRQKTPTWPRIWYRRLERPHIQ